MNPGVSQIMLGLVAVVGGILTLKAAGSGIGWIVFVLGLIVAIRGGIALSQSGEKEIGN
jgi:hypothetical protein